MPSNTLLIDANSIFYAAQYATKLSSGSLPTQAVFGAVKMARELRVLYPTFSQLWCHDTRATWRFDIHPGYKAGRDDTEAKVEAKSELEEQRPYIRRAFAALGLRQMTVNGYEADDIIGFMSVKLAAAGGQVGIISGDQDLCQLVRSNVFWRDMRDDAKLVTLSNLMDKTGYATPLAFLDGKCLTGDTSDKICGVGGIGDSGAPEFIAEFGSVREFWRRCDAGEYVPTKKAHRSLWKGTCPYTKDEWIESFAGDEDDVKAVKKHINDWPGQGRLIYGRNLRLMQLLKVPAPNKADIRLERNEFDETAFIELCEELSFHSILKNVDNFTKPFKE